MKVSVIIPVYNVEKYIEKCILSVINNNLMEGDYEIIVIDDETPDGSVAIVTELANKHTGITIISQKNKGLGGARNTGILAAKGDYLLFLDSDDWFLPNTLQQICTIAQENQVEVLEFSAQGIDVNGVIKYHIENTTNGKFYSGVNYYNSIRYMNSACNKLYKREFLLQEKLLFLERIFIEDFEFNTRVFCKLNKVMAVPNLVAQFLQSDDSITRNTDASKKEKMYHDFIHIIELTHQEYKKNSNLSEAENHFFKERLSFLVATLFFQFFKNKVSYKQIITFKKTIKDKGLLYIHHPIHDRKKDIFRRLFLKHTWLFSISQPLLKWVK